MEFQLNARRLSAAALVLAVGTVPMVAGNANAAVSKTHAKHLAKAGVLTKKDLPGWTATPDAGDGPFTAGDDVIDKQVTKCLGATEPKVIVENAGLDFAKGLQEIDSSSSVVKSAKSAAAYLKASTSAKGAACFTKYFPAAMKNEGVTVSHLSVKAVRVKVSGADHAAGLHIIATITTPQGPVPLEFNQLGALVGATEIDLTGVGFAHKAPKFSQLEGLAHKLVKRVHAA